MAKEIFVIEARYVAESSAGIITKKGKVLRFDDEDQARTFGRENIEGSRYVASWEAINLTTAKQRGHSI